MEFDIIPVTDKQLSEYTVIQMQLLRTAQKRKNELKQNLDDNIAAFKRMAYSNNMKDSSIINDKTNYLTAVYEREVAIIAEQLEYSLKLNSPTPDGDPDPDVGYIVDYKLSYNERYIIVRDYYLSIPDPVERLSIYEKDEVARKYLDSYYSTLWSLLYNYSKKGV